MTKKNKQKQGVLVFGVHAVLELLKAKRRKVISIYTTKQPIKAWGSIEKYMPKYPVNLQYVTRDTLTRIAGTNDHQGIMAWANPFPIRKKFFDPKKHPALLMLDGIQDVRNLGALLRSAYCTNITGIILCKKNAASLEAAAFKASAGLAEHLEVYESPSAQAAVQELKAAGYQIYVTMFDGKRATEIAYTAPLCLVIGSEATGVSKDIIKHGAKVTLPQQPGNISYNASVAGGILMFLVATQNKLI